MHAPPVLSFVHGSATRSLAILILAGAAYVHAATPQRSDVAGLAAQADAARQASRIEEAIELYKKGVAIQPEWAEGWWHLGTVFYEREAYADAAAALAKAVKLAPKAGVGFAMLGLAEAKLGRNQAALEHIEAARRLGINGNGSLRPVLLYTKGMLLLKAGEFGRAQDTLGTLARTGADQDELMLALGMSVLGLRPQALESADATTIDIVRRAGRAEHLAAQRRTAEAAEAYARLATEAPRFHDVQFAYGRFLLATHQDEKAVEAFQREIENTPNHLLARLGIAGVKRVSDPSGGLPYAEQAVKLAPHLAETHYLLGVLLLETGATLPAIRELERARRAAPEEAKIYFALGRAYTAVGRQDEATRARAAFSRLSQEVGIPVGTTP